MNVLVVLARVAVPGRGKTRLRAALGDAAVDALAAALVGDVLAWSSPGVDAIVVAHDGPAALLPASTVPQQLVPQVSGDFGARIDAAVAAGFAHGATRVVIVGTDCPTLPAALVEACFDRLNVAASTLVPATDGGWIALGVDRPLHDALRDVTWSTEHTAAETSAALSADGRPPLVLPAWHDIDEPADLDTLTWDEQRRARAPRTAAVLAGLPSPVL